MVGSLPAWDDSPSGPQTIERPRLEGRLADVMSHRLTLITAGAGFGKSTLLRAWSAASSSVIHVLSEDDRSPAILMGSLIDALRTRVPGLAHESAATVDTFAEDGAAAQASVLAEALRKRLTRPLIIMLDEWEAIAGSPGEASVDAFLRQAPSRVRIVLSGRSAPSFRLARLRGQGQILTLGPSELAFTLAETQQMATLHPENLDADLIRDTHEIVAGWPVGVRIALEVMAAAPADDRRAVLERARRPGGPLSTYLAEEALDLEDEADRRLLSAAAPLGGFSTELCVSLGFPDAAKQIDRLMRRGIYLETHDGHYTVMPLVSGFLTSHDQLDPGERRRLAAVASMYHAERSAWTDALHCARFADAADVCLELIDGHGEEVLSTGHARTLLEAAELLPEGMRTARVDRFVAEGLFLTGRWDAASAIFDRLMAGDGAVDPGLAWRAGLVRQLRGDFAGAIERYERAAEDGALADRALALGWWAAALWVAGDVDACRSLTAGALDLATRSGDDRALANAHTAAAMVAAIEDDRRANDAHYLKALDHAIAANDVIQQIRIRVNRSSRHLEEGSYVEAIEEATVALRLAELSGFIAFQALGLLNRGRASLRLGRLDEAVSDFESARRLWDELGSKQVAYALNRLGDVHRIRGDFALARASYEEARSISESAEDRQGLVPALAGLAQVLVADEPENALMIAELGVSSGPVLGHAGALLALGWVHLQRGETEEATEMSDRAAAVARKRRDRAGLAEALELKGIALGQPGQLEESASIWKEVGDPLAHARVELALLEMVGGTPAEAERLAITLQRFGARGPATRAIQLAEAFAVRARPEVEIRTLGGFQVIVEDRPVPITAWQSKKARDLLKLLVARRGRTTHREVIIESLWPEEDPAKTGNRLSVTLTTIRNILDPEHRHDADHFIHADRNTVALSLDHITTDIEIFLSDAQAALDSHRGAPTPASYTLLMRAEAAYVGEFMEEDPYAEWAVSLREEARQTYLSCTRAIAQTATEQGDHEEAARYHLRTLERDPFDEAAHLGLVRSMSAMGRHGEALRLYRRYGERMAELGIEAAPFSPA